MNRVFGAVCLALSLVGCDRVTGGWKQKYMNELNYHQQTQQIKNAEIAARDLEAENQREFMAILADRIKELEKSNERLRAELHGQKSKGRGPVSPVTGRVTAVAGEIGVVVLDVGSDRGLLEGDRFEITRDGKRIVVVQLDRADRTWSAGKIVEGDGAPLKGDAATLLQK